MALKRKTKDIKPKKVESMEMAPEVKIEERIDEEEQLDPAEEKMLDRILMGVVVFILVWLALSIILVVLGYFGVWK